MQRTRFSKWLPACAAALVLGISASQALAGSIFLTGHDPDYHAVGSGHGATGAQHINQVAISYVTDAAFNPFTAGGVSKFLFVHSNIAVPAGHRDGVIGMMPEVEVIEGYISGLGVSNASTVVIVPAGSGASEFGAAARVYWTFKYLGHDDVAILDGGWNAWLEDSANPVASGAAKMKPAMFIAKPRPEILVSTSEVAPSRTSRENRRSNDF